MELPSYVHLQQQSLHTPFTSVPELGAISQPFARDTKQPYSYTGSDDSDSLVSV